MKMGANPLSATIAAINTGKSWPATQLVRSDPQLAATISKLIANPVRSPSYDSDGRRTVENPNDVFLRQQAERSANRISNSETVLEVLPDTELAAQILVSVVLSPKDMTTVTLTYRPPEDLLPSDVSAALIDRVRQHFDRDYKIESLLPEILRDILVTKGSYPVAVIPENSIDEVINGRVKPSTEALRDLLTPSGGISSLNLLGPVTPSKPTPERTSSSKISLESFTTMGSKEQGDNRLHVKDRNNIVVESYTTVTDNFSILKIPELRQKMKEATVFDRIKSPIRNHGDYSLESMEERLNDRELAALLYRNRNMRSSPVTVLKTQEQLSRRTVGNPLIMPLPAESVIPAYVPGNEKIHVGFFVLIDENGHPISRQEGSDNYQQLGARLSGNAPFAQALTQRVGNAMNGAKVDYNQPEQIRFAAQIYAEMVEQDLIARLKHGIYGNGVSLGRHDEVYRIMLARALSQQQTQVLFVPVELMTYMALNYDRSGIGRSLLDEMQILSSLRTVLMFSNVMAGVKNSVMKKEVRVKLDPDDPDPLKTAERVQYDIQRSFQQGFPIGVSAPADVVDYLQRAAFEFTFEGHPGLPDMSVEFGEKASSFPKPDLDLQEDLRKQMIMRFGLSPDTVDSAYQGELATSIVTNNILLTKRVAQLQSRFTPQVSDHLRKVAMNSEGLMNDLRAILRDNSDKVIRWLAPDSEYAKRSPQAEAGPAAGSPAQAGKSLDDNQRDYLVTVWLDEFVKRFEVSLPEPNSVTLENQYAALEIYEKAFDKAIDSWVSSEFLNADTVGDVSEKVDTLKSVIKAQYMRQWMSENGFMPELADLVTLDEEGLPKVQMYHNLQEHITALNKTIPGFFKGLAVVKAAGNKVMAELNEVDNTTAEAPSFGGGDSGGSDLGTGSDFGGSDLDFGSLDLTAEETGSSTTMTSEETSSTETSTSATGKPEEESATPEPPAASEEDAEPPAA